MDNEDVEDWLVEEGIGYYDDREQFQYGVDPKVLEQDDIGDMSGEFEWSRVVVNEGSHRFRCLCSVPTLKACIFKT